MGFLRYQLKKIWCKPIGFKINLLNHHPALRDSRSNLAYSLIYDIPQIAPVTSRVALYWTLASLLEQAKLLIIYYYNLLIIFQQTY